MFDNKTFFTNPLLNKFYWRIVNMRAGKFPTDVNLVSSVADLNTQM